MKRIAFKFQLAIDLIPTKDKSFTMYDQQTCYHIKYSWLFFGVLIIKKR